MKFSNKTIIAGIKKYAKDLSDEEVLSLFKKVKEKLNSQNPNEDQALDGGKSGEEPMGDENNSLVPKIEETPTKDVPATETEPEENGPSDGDIDESIDDLLNSLGLGEDSESKPQESTQENIPEQETQEKEASVEDVVTDDDEDVIGDLLKNMETEDDNTEGDEISAEGDGQKDPFSPDNFKTAGRGFQINRKDKDLMADDATGPKYKDDGKLPPRTDCRRSNGIRWNRSEDKQDKDIEGDKDLK